MEEIKRLTGELLGLGLDPQDFTFQHIALRGTIVFFIAIVMVRLGDKRFLSQKTAFDAILGFILASMLARTVNGSAAFWPTLAAGFVLVGLHRLVALTSRRFHSVGHLVKGHSDLLIKDGVLNENAMRKNDLTPNDVSEDLRLQGAEHPRDVHLAYVERNGKISVVLNKDR